LFEREQEIAGDLAQAEQIAEAGLDQLGEELAMGEDMGQPDQASGQSESADEGGQQDQAEGQPAQADESGEGPAPPDDSGGPSQEAEGVQQGSEPGLEPQEPGGQGADVPGEGPASQPPSPPPLPSPAELANVPIREAAMLAAELAGLLEAMEGSMGEMTDPMAASPSQQPMPGTPDPMIGEGGVSQPGPWVENQPGLERPLTEIPGTRRQTRESPDSDHDPDLDELQLLEEPWFAKLPPDVRAAIRNNARQRAPRGYRERLKKYFENLE
jgi:hypothetical protein